jgi:Tfp pilus assembly protein PilF
MIRSLASFMVLLVFSPLLAAQTQTEAKDNCNLSVQIRTSDERVINTPIQVEVLSPGGVIGRVQTMGGEPAEFRVTNGKTYRLTVSGPGVETITAQFEKAITEYPRYARAYDMLGVIAIKSSDRSKARELFSKSIQADGTFLPAYVNLARLDLQEQNYAESESLLAKVLTVNPAMPEAAALLATTEFANKEYEKALADVDRTHALRNHEPFAEVHIMAAKVLRLQDHPDTAIVQLQLFLKEKPDSPQVASVRETLAALGAAPQP